MKRVLSAGLAAALCLITTLGASAAGLERHERIRAVAADRALSAARSFAPAGAEVEVEAARLDPRLALPACPAELEAFDPPAHAPGAHVTVGVRCPVAPGWSLYVPVRVKALVDVVVLAAPVALGEPLTASDVRLETRDVAGLGTGYLTRLEEALGMTLRRPARPGTALAPTLLERPKLVRRGQRVTLVAGDSPVAVRSEGEALGDAAAGERVRVRNLRSRMVVEGVVDASGAVRTGGRLPAFDAAYAAGPGG
ncbi:MAG TPA: flagellar basal body P-ring formation chaperone FlgA [Gammaproteobacteria bacterium]